MKKWKKNHRERKRRRKYAVFTIKFSHDEFEDYIKINEYRILHNYSWAKFVSVAINNAWEIYKFETY